MKLLLLNLMRNKYVLYVMGSVILATVLYMWHLSIVSLEVNHAKERVRSELVEKYRKALQEQIDESHKTETKLYQDSINKLAEKDEQIQTLNSRVGDLIVSLQKRNSRAGDTNDSKTPGTCTGAELYREDGQFLIGEASRAERIRVERDFYYQQYETVRQELEALKKTNK